MDARLTLLIFVTCFVPLLALVIAMSVWLVRMVVSYLQSAPSPRTYVQMFTDPSQDDEVATPPVGNDGSSSDYASITATIARSMKDPNTDPSGAMARNSMFDDWN